MGFMPPPLALTHLDRAREEASMVVGVVVVVVVVKISWVLFLHCHLWLALCACAISQLSRGLELGRWRIDQTSKHGKSCCVVVFVVHFPNQPRPFFLSSPPLQPPKSSNGVPEM